MQYGFWASTQRVGSLPPKIQADRYKFNQIMQELVEKLGEFTTRLECQAQKYSLGDFGRKFDV
jgi:hypothetical protein